MFTLARKMPKSLGMDNLVSFKRGEVLAREGDPISHLAMIKSGRVSVFLERSGKKIEIMTLTASQIFGEAAAFAPAKHPFSYEAHIDTKVIIVPIELIRQQVNGSPASAKLLVKNLVDQVKNLLNSFRSVRMEQDKSPCPQMVIPKIFAILNNVARLTGQKTPDKPNEVLLDWGTLKIQCSRLFLESPPRMRSLLDLLLKLKHLELRFEKNDEGEEELSKVLVYNVQFIDDFSEFYQYNLFKGGRSEIIYLDPLAHRVARAMVDIAKPEPADGKGVVHLDYEKLVAELKRKYQIEMKETHLNALEKKGLFVKRQAGETNTRISFDKAEYERVVAFWNVLAEIDEWNEKGFVDLTVKKEVRKESEAESAIEQGAPCGACGGLIQTSHKFCPHCGAKQAA